MDKYTPHDIARIWSDQEKLRYWTNVEVAVLLATHPELMLDLPEDLCPTVPEVHAHEAQTGHELVAFLHVLEKRLPPAAARWLHHGLTSSDVQDTATAMQLTDTNSLIHYRAIGLHHTLTDPRFEVQVQGYTHGQPASGTTIGNRFCAQADQLLEFRTRPVAGKISGAVGTRPVISRLVEADILESLGLRASLGHTTQVVPRAEFQRVIESWVALVQVCEQVALDVRLMSAFGDVSERRQGAGSSAMPHKVNPILAERVCGLARVVRGLAHATRESQALWLDRDLTHSSVERVCYPKLAAYTAHCLDLTIRLLCELEVHPEPLQEVATLAEPLMVRATFCFDLPRSVVYRAVRAALATPDPEINCYSALSELTTPELDFDEFVSGLSESPGGQEQPPSDSDRSREPHEHTRG